MAPLPSRLQPWPCRSKSSATSKRSAVSITSDEATQGPYTHAMTWRCTLTEAQIVAIVVANVADSHACSLEPLALGPDWHDPLPLISLDDALERTLLRTDLSREALIQRLLADVGQPALHPLLWVLPRRWRLAPAALPPRLQGLSALLQQGLISPVFLAALVDDLAHLWPPNSSASSTPLQRWQAESGWDQGSVLPLPADLAGLAQLCDAALQQEPESPPPGSSPPPPLTHLSQGLRWQNTGLSFSQPPPARRANGLMAQVFNRLAANTVTAESFVFEGCQDGASLLTLLSRCGWSVQARLRCSIASFGFGASLTAADEPPRQIPLALPMRTGLLDARGEEATTLLLHTALELELQQGEQALRLQWFQGTGGLCGWDALNDLHRPWQNDRANGTVRYLGEPFTAVELPTVLQLSELIALLHNQEATAHQLRLGGYGSLGFCIDSTALLQLAVRGCCDLFPLLLSGLWRERLDQRAAVWEAGGGAHAALVPLYRTALRDLPLDLSQHGAGSREAWRRLQASLPQSSPFALIQQLRSSSQAPSPDSAQWR